MWSTVCAAARNHFDLSINCLVLCLMSYAARVLAARAMARAKMKAKTKAKAKAVSSSRKVLKKPAAVAATKNQKRWANNYAAKKAKVEARQIKNCKHRSREAARRNKPYVPRDKRLEEVAKVATEGLNKSMTALKRVDDVEVTATRALHIAREAIEGSEKCHNLVEKANMAVADVVTTQAGFESWVREVEQTADKALKIAMENSDKLVGMEEDSPTSEREEDSPSSPKTLQ